MRLVAGVLAVMLFAPAVRADDTVSAEPARPAEVRTKKVPLRVVRILPESQQALLFDRARATHVLAEVGGEVSGYTVEDIGEDEVTLRQGDTLIVLSVPDSPAAAPAPDAAPARERAPHAESGPTVAPAPAPEGDGGPAPVDPYREPTPRVVAAPTAAAPATPALTPGEGGIRVARAPGTPEPAVASTSSLPALDAAAVAPTSSPDAAGATAPAPPQPATAVASKPDRPTADARALADILTSSEPASPRAPSPAPEPGARSGAQVILSRGELLGALSDFTRLAAAVRGSFSPAGVLPAGVVLERVGDGTIFQRAGLRTGDVVTAVDGAPLRTIDDAADLYARAATAKAFTVQLVRAGKPVVLHVKVQ